MARGVLPIVEINRILHQAGHHHLPIEVYWALSPVVKEDKFTQTFRVKVPPERRKAVERRIRTELHVQTAAVLLEILEDNNWDVSFLADFY